MLDPVAVGGRQAALTEFQFLLTFAKSNWQISVDERRRGVTFLLRAWILGGAGCDFTEAFGEMMVFGTCAKE